MVTPTKDRQQKWKDKQTAEGKKSISVMISAEVKEMIDKEKAHTGDTISQIIERCVREHLKNAPSNRRMINLDPNNLTNQQRGALKSVRMKENNMGWKLPTIADNHNRTKRKTLSGAAEWDVAEVQAALDYIDKHELWFKL